MAEEKKAESVRLDDSPKNEEEIRQDELLTAAKESGVSAESLKKENRESGCEIYRRKHSGFGRIRGC